MSTFTTVIGLAAAVCTTAANLPQLKKAWTTGQTDDISLKMLLLLGCGLGLWVVLSP
jgi:MtN3 and saliva related transmembrane protein